MPAKSAKQYNFMQAAANGGLKSSGPSKEVAKEFIKATPKGNRSKWSMKKKKPL